MDTTSPEYDEAVKQLCRSTGAKDDPGTRILVKALFVESRGRAQRAAVVGVLVGTVLGVACSLFMVWVASS